MSYSCKIKRDMIFSLVKNIISFFLFYKDANVTEKKRSVFEVNVCTKKSPVLLNRGFAISVISSAQEQVFLLSDHKLLKARNTG